MSLHRRDFIALLGGATAAWPLAARAQRTESMRRIGVLMPHSEDDPLRRAELAAFIQRFAELGWNGGRNVQIAFVTLLLTLTWRRGPRRSWSASSLM
jgi:putative ABC transport system substrate-binding protein